MKTLTKILGTATILATLATTASATDINPTLKGGLLNGKSSIVAGVNLTRHFAPHFYIFSSIL